MKKRTIFCALMLAVAMLVSACGSSNQSEVGKWTGRMDLTKQFEDGIAAAHPALASYIDFEDLVFVLDITFEEGQMSMTVQQDSVTAFEEHFATGMKAIAEGYWEDCLKSYDMSLEEAIAESGMDEEAYYEYIYEQTGVAKMIGSMTDVTTSTLNKLSAMTGTYTMVGDELRLYYGEDENEYEAMQYAFKGKNLNIIIQGDGFSLLIQCEKND